MKFSRRRAYTPVLCFMLVLGIAMPSLGLSQTAEPLLQKSNLVYLGGFRVPNMPCTPPTNACFGFGGYSLAYNAANNSLYIVGDLKGQLTAEITIPPLVNSSDVNDMKVATLMQPFTDALEGQRNAVNPTDPNPHYIGGQLVYDGKLVVSVYSYYDADVTQSTSHFVRPLNLSVTGQVQGPFRVGTQYPGYVGGYMTTIPPEWQVDFGGPALTGNCCVPGAGWQSQGPAVSVFDPANLGTANPVPATPLVDYPLRYALGGGWNVQNPYFNGTTEITGIVFPPGTRSVLFFGRHGIGPWCYGVGTGDLSQNGQPYPGTKTRYCYDPAEIGSKGTHAYPYVYQVWAYDANDLLTVRKGLKRPYQLTPYAVWTYDLPFEVSTNAHHIGGAAFDPTTQRIYVSQVGTAAGPDPVIQVFQVNLQAPPPTAPSNVAVH